MIKPLSFLAAFLAVTARGHVSEGGPKDVDNSPVTIFKGKFRTMDESWPRANYVAVQSGKVLQVGTLPDIKRSLDLMLDKEGNKVEYTIDTTLENFVIFPGFIEPHTHPFGGGFAMKQNILATLPVGNPYGPDKGGIMSKDDALAKLREMVDAAENKNETILTWGYDTVALGGYLEKRELDEVSDITPIMVWDASEHFVFINTPAMKLYYNASAMSEVVGVQFDENNEANGQFLGTNAMLMIVGQVLFARLRANPNTFEESLDYMVDLSRLNGVTLTQEMTVGAGLSDPLEEATRLSAYFNRDDVPMRCQGVLDGRTVMAYMKNDFEKALEFSYEMVNNSTDYMFYGDAVKFFADDAFLSLGMYMENPGYYDRRDGLYITDPDKMVENWEAWWKAGKQIHIHANGNGGTEATLRAVEHLQENFPRNDHRFCFQHYGISTPEMAPRLNTVGAIVSTNPYYLYGRSEYNAPIIGADRAYTAARMNTLLKAGVKVAMHFDSPVAPPLPLTGVWIAVNRFGYSMSPPTVRGPKERVTVHQALKMITIDAAYSLFLEDKLGTISPGKYADFAVLYEDPYQVPKECIREIQVWGTVVGGKIYSNADICKNPKLNMTEAEQEACPKPTGKSAKNCDLLKILDQHM